MAKGKDRGPNQGRLAKAAREAGGGDKGGRDKPSRGAESKTQYLFGIHSVQAALDKQPGKVKQLFMQSGRKDKRSDQLINSARQNGVSVQSMHKDKLDDLSEGLNHQGIVAIFTGGSLWNEDDLDDILLKHGNKVLILALDGVTDPHNLGACLRSADGAGVHAVIAPKDKSVGLTPVTRKVACGAADTIPFIQVTNLARTLRAMQDDYNVWVVGLADEEDAGLYEAKFDGPIAMVMGAEGDGMRRLTRDTCDQIVAIPMLGSVSSLNVSVATGVCLYEVHRQRSSAK